MGRRVIAAIPRNQEMQRAIGKLKKALRPVGIEPTVEIKEIDEKSFRANPSESNRIGSRADPWRNGLVLESEAVVALLFVGNARVER